MNGEVEIVIEAAHGIDTGTGEWEGLRVRYRSAGTRTYGKFLVVGARDQSLRDLLSAALLIVSHSGVPFDREAAVSGAHAQLQLGATA